MNTETKQATAIEMIPCKSSQIAAIGHDPETNTLAIQFPAKTGTGSVYHYQNFTAEDDQGELDLDPARLSKLAFPMLAQPLKWEKEYTGYTFVLHYGIDDKSNTTLKDCRESNRRTGHR